jgi:peptide/nickel transport system substrate-binding protein
MQAGESAMKKRSWLLVAVIAAFSYAIVACGSAPAAPATPEQPVPPAPSPVATQEEAPAEVETEEPAGLETQEPAEVETPEPAEAGEAPDQYNEAPQLAQQVQAGQLPPVEERLPENPMVIPVIDEIGTYGGIMRRAYIGPADTCNFWRVSRDGLLRFSVDGFSLIPAVAESLEPNEDATVWTAKLRKGMKWSDGHPFTADDLVYQYEKRILNDEITPVKPLWLKIGDQLGEVKKVDEVTVQFIFPTSNYLFPEIVAQADEACGRDDSGDEVPYAPAHYMRQFNKEINPNVEAEASAAGFENWVLYYQTKDDYALNPEKPSLRPWILKNDFTAQRIVAERNPYFYAVDPEGNQLPYIDRVVFDLVESREVLQLKAVAGEIDFQGRHIALEDFPVLKENDAAGGYEVLTWPGFGGVDVRFAINQSYQGPGGDLLRNRDFRIALSHAINREEINQISFLGLGIPRQGVPAPGHPHYPGEEVEKKFTEFNPDLANQMLDQIIPNRDPEGFRTLPGGGRLEIVITVTEAFGAWPDVAEQVARMWEAVGVRTKPDVVVRTLLETRAEGNEVMVTVWNEDQTGFTFSAPTKSAPMDEGNHWAPAYGLWISTDGAQGIEPPPEIKELVEWHRQGLTVPDAERAELAKQIYTFLVNQQYIIGVAGLSPMVQGVIIKNEDLRNVPEVAANDWPLRTGATAFPEQFFYAP